MSTSRAVTDQNKDLKQYMIDEVIFTIGKSMGAALVAVLAGFSAVAVFNGMPPGWLTDYGETPSDELLDRSKPRIKSNPWAYILSIAMSLAFIKFIFVDYRFFACGVFLMWVLAVMALADVKYRIIPDQFVILAFISGFGFIPFVDSWRDQLLGLLIGSCVMLLVATIAKIALKQMAVGGGDIKLFAALGICLGVKGVVTVMILTCFIMGIHALFKIGKKELSLNDALPMAPYIFVSTGLYLAIIWEFQLNLEI